eukprot:CAMPEP_0172664010 /NCGR_PEP_ID=MMETSP1074-20121228/6307_1 /TAXON_ID=2916 /ORGANISM="Ceratium fusus, Strain PA161109" /LENGTH=45 /DNA_ID= /DNA_START= /DNA_END= /DNA_ORIENTATION=
MQLGKVPAVVEHNVVASANLPLDVLHLFLWGMLPQNAASEAPLRR